MEEHLNTMFETFHELEEMSSQITKELAVYILLSSVGSEYETLITALEAWEEKRLTLQAVRMKILDEWRRKNNTVDSSGLFEAGESALSSARGRDECMCYNCDKKGHISRNCRAPRKRNAEGNANVVRKRDSSSDGNAGSSRRVAFMAHIGSKIHRRKEKERVCYECRSHGHN